ncbi:phage protein [Leptospira stimsonii]|uniref:DUF2804 domain-containing protein n=1 Tax=Leptospira stimsonii TaxID=2202203 RepID=A0ABY2N136_9LEPT|nr:hypothetical protein [Leptospira stimsonii]TGK19777.1 hypothetical protein EHO98_10875 [Leptospira stimsonii]TGM13775.1 hypothetical protein EHQ90_13270 [Leptospira stimsonii]
MTPNPKLFGRVVSLEILPKSGNAKKFTYPSFDMEFESELNSLNSTTVTIYNVNEETMALIGAKTQGSGFQYPSVFLNAGYKDENGLVASGNVILPKFKQDGTNKILEFQINANAGIWSRTYIMKTYSKLPATSVILDILERGNMKPGKIALGEDRIINFSANDSLGECINQFCSLTKSQYWIQDGLLHIDSKQPKQKQSVLFLDSTSGLIGIPEQEEKKWKVTSLFRHKFKKNMIISIHGGKLKGECRIIGGKHKFSTFQSENYSELEVTPL